MVKIQDQITIHNKTYQDLAKKSQVFNLILFTLLIFLIKETKEPKHKRAVELRKKLFGTLVPIDLKIYSKDEFETESKKPFSFLNGALKNSSVLYEQ